MPGELKNWAENNDPKEEQARVAAKALLMKMPPSATGHGVAVPFPFRDRQEYKAFHSNKEINKRIKTAPVVDMPLKGLFSVQHSVKPRLVAYYIDNPERQTGRMHPKTGTPQDLPIILQQGGVRWVFDGNHRATAAMLRGEKSIQARYVNFDDDHHSAGSFDKQASASADTLDAHDDSSKSSKTSSSSSSSS